MDGMTQRILREASDLTGLRLPSTALDSPSTVSEHLEVLLEAWSPVLAEVMASPEGPEDLRAVVHYLHKVGPEGAMEALWRVLDWVGRKRREEEEMAPFTVPILEEARVRGVKEGQAQVLSQAVLRILASRGISVDEGTRQRILECKDPAILDRWFDRALKATSLADLEDPERNG
jgi:hypothetical protein